MSSRSARLNVRIPEEDMHELEAIRERAGHDTVSDVVRDAIASYLSDEVATWNSERITALVPSALAEDLEMFIASGDAADISQAVTLALTSWVEEKKRYYLEGRETVTQKIREAMDQRDTRRGMARIATEMRKQ